MISNNMQYDVFISYSRKDYDEVKVFVDMLKECIPTLEVWMDLKEITVADEFDEKIISAIDSSSYVIFALSPNSNSIGEGSSKWTKKELVYAKNTDKKVIPVLLNGAKLNSWFLFEFGRTDSIDTTDTLQVEKLIENLSVLTKKPTLQEELRREKEHREREAELARKETELDRLHKEKELQKRIAQVEDEKKALEENMHLVEVNARQVEENARQVGEAHRLEQVKRDVLPEGKFQVGELMYKALGNTHGVTICKLINKDATEIHIPSQIKYGECSYSVMNIRMYAFAGCSNLTSISFPNSLTSIGYCAFANCSGLTSISFPNSVTSIRRAAFVCCSGLTSVIIGNNVTSIGDEAFYGCKSLNTIRYDGTMLQWKSISKGIYWKRQVPAKVVHCTDGDVKLWWLS